jgi:hypothetical protein
MFGKNNKCVLEFVNGLIFRDKFFFSKDTYNLPIVSWFNSDWCLIW